MLIVGFILYVSTLLGSTLHRPSPSQFSRASVHCSHKLRCSFIVVVELKYLSDETRITMFTYGFLLAVLASCPCLHALNVKISKRILATVLVGATFNVPVPNALFNDHLLSPVLTNAILPAAHAEFRAAQKRTYFRFVPKLVAGRDFYKVKYLILLIHIVT
jgi:hypothetical protein